MSLNTNNRPHIPKQFEREVLVEAGHRCAIPTCQSVPIEIAHIIPWAIIKTHTFDNLIALCPTCHTRFDRGDIDRKSMLQYKSNLTILANRYGDLEQRILRLFADNPSQMTIMIPGGLDILLMYLIKDKLIVPTGRNSGVILSGVPSGVEYGITSEGRNFINHWLQADPLE